MKTIRLYSTLAVLMLLTAQCGREQENQQTDFLYVVVDKTEDDRGADISFCDLKPFIRATSTDPLSGAHIRFSLLTDKKYNSTRSVTLPAVSELESNEIKRKKDVALFETRADSCLKACIETRSGYDHSEIFGAMALLIEDLANCSGTKRLVIVSDLHHNTSTFSVYDTEDFSALQQDPNRIAELLPVSVPLTGMDIHLVHASRNTGDDVLFDGISTILRRYLQSKGARVHIGSSLTL